MKWLKSHRESLKESQEKEREERLGELVINAIEEDDPVLLKRALHDGADPDSVGVSTMLSNEFSPLALAIAMDRIECIEILLEAGADPNGFDPGWYAPLHRAISVLNLRAAEDLLEAGADPNLKDPDGDTPLSIWRMHHGSFSPVHSDDTVKEMVIFKLLIKWGADPVKAWDSIDDLKGNRLVGGDLSWFPGGEEALKRRFLAKETRRKMF